MEHSVKHKLELLDGYRGLAANIVLIQHTLNKFRPNAGDYEVFRWTGTYIGVSAFFVLSAFLLTYRLTIDLTEATTYRLTALRIIQYFIRRFFRIYLVFVVFWTLVHHGPLKLWLRGYYSNYANYNKGLTLGFLGNNHMWTVPPEIRYYFYIPVFTLFSVKARKFWYVVVIVAAIAVLIVELFNPFSFKSADYNIWNPYYVFSTRFTVFFSGTLLAIIYFNLKSIDFVDRILQNYYFCKILSICIVIAFLLQFRIYSAGWSHMLTFQKDTFASGLYQVGFLALLLMLNEKNIISDFYNSRYLTACGKYSFGIYLVHPAFVQYFSTFKFKYIFQMLSCVMACSLVFGAVWFYVCENILIKCANYLCKKVDHLELFKKPSAQMITNTPCSAEIP